MCESPRLSEVQTVSSRNRRSHWRKGGFTWQGCPDDKTGQTDSVDRTHHATQLARSVPAASEAAAAPAVAQVRVGPSIAPTCCQLQKADYLRRSRWRSITRRSAYSLLETATGRRTELLRKLTTLQDISQPALNNVAHLFGVNAPKPEEPVTNTIMG